MSDEPPRVDEATLPSEALGAPPGPRSVFFKVLSGFLSGALLVLLFLAIIPKLGDFGGVKDSIAGMRPAAVVGLFVIALAIRVLSSAGYTVLTPGLTVWRSLIAREVSASVSNIVPGPSGTAAQYVVLRSWGVRTEQFVRATISVGVCNNTLIFCAPGAFFVVWAVLGMPEAKDGNHAWAFGLLAVTVGALAILLVAAVARSERMAASVGRLGQSCVNPARRVAGKDAVADWPDRCVALRSDTLTQLRAHGVGVVGCVGGGYLLNAVLLVFCMYECGISREQLPWSLGLLLYSVCRVLTSVSITPGGVGVVEIVYTAVFVAVLGEPARNDVIAAVLVYRALTYLLPIITGAIAYLIWRLMRRHELHDEGAARAAASAT
jgi:uncharacterized membrane protein YbhN (UPF0104 family)